MTHWTMTDNRMVDDNHVCDLNSDGMPVMTGVPYRVAFDHVLANGADTDTYSESHMSKPQTIAELRAEQAEQERRFAQD